MTSIVKASEKDSALVSEIARDTFLESHGNSASPEDVSNYVVEKYSEAVLRQELRDPKNIYYIIYHDKKPAGYSKIIFGLPYENSPVQNIAKLERIYLLKAFYDQKLGLELLQFNIELSKKNDQAGIWLYVWKANPRAVNFYIKAGFKIIGSHDFKISETHSNPNHQMLLRF
ncbi:MAG TPA: GNAT family N-acetyltransferase [Ferruginibacter sp.]|nr:GNAT family N-acetyltransferase [Ferruginibacter sp.]